MTIDEGFILSNKFRMAIFDELASGENDIYRIAKKHHIIQNVVRRITEEFINGGILEKKGNKYILTKEGEKLANSIR